MVHEDATWHVIIANEQKGPLTKAQVLQYFKDGLLTQSDLVWRPAFDKWETLSQAADLWRPPSISTSERDAVQTLQHSKPDEVLATKRKWSLWKSANVGLLVSAIVLATGPLTDRGVETARYVQTGSVEAVSYLLGQIMAAPLIFVFVAIVRNAISWRQPQSSARAARGALTFVFLLSAICVTLKLYSSLLFSSTDRISGVLRKEFVEDVQKSCIKKQRSLGGNLSLDDEQIAKYCSCTADMMANGTTYKQLNTELDAFALDDLRKKTEAAANACRA
jgi:hypothetical protein